MSWAPPMSCGPSRISGKEEGGRREEEEEEEEEYSSTNEKW